MGDAQDPSGGALAAGDLIAGRWELLAPVSQGRRSEVWRGFDRRLERPVALKFVRGEFLDDPKALRSFERQLELLGGVEDPHVMRILDAVQDDGRLILICELIDGIHLDEVMASRNPLTTTAVAALGVQLAQGLAAMHRQALVHRDVQPHNVVVTPSGIVKLVGVGAIKWAFAESTITDRASLLADATYLAPEQLSGSGIDPRIDVYATGLVLWEALTGRPPPELWADEAPDENDHLLARPSTFRSDVPSQLDDAIWTATAVDPAERFPGADALAEVLAELAPARPSDATRELHP